MLLSEVILVTPTRVNFSIPALKTKVGGDTVWISNMNNKLLDHNEFATKLHTLVAQSKSLVYLLPLIFMWKGSPVQLDQHYLFEPLFDLIQPRKTLLKCGRQVGKSFQTALQIVTQCVTHPHFSVLFTTPLFEQVRRFSTLYLAELITESPSKRVLTGRHSTNQVLQRTLGNKSTIFLGYASRDANRIRGASANKVCYDEFQLFIEEVIPVIRNVMGGSKYGNYELFSGTPLTPNNILDQTWRRTSMSEWMIPCRHCTYDNVAAVEFDLMAMIGPYHTDISEKTPGIVCRKCRKPLYTQDGVWWHRKPELWNEFRGMHLPQVIMPWHATDPARWKDLQATISRNDEQEIYNEICAESCDSGFKPITTQQLQAAACLGHKNALDEALAKKNDYVRLVMGIDWGGGGVMRTSRTKAAVIGQTYTGATHVLFGIDMNANFNPVKEARALLGIANLFNCELIAHDASGGLGNVSENILETLGLFGREIFPMTYTGTTAAGSFVTEHLDHATSRVYYTVDRSRTIQFLYETIKRGKLLFFDYDYVSPQQPGLMQDFLNVSAEIARTGVGRDVLMFVRDESQSDDFLHAVNFGCSALWAKYNNWPSVAVKANPTLNDIAEFSAAGTRFSSQEIQELLREVTVQPLFDLGQHY
jgi:hypothetical protein